MAEPDRVAHHYAEIARTLPPPLVGATVAGIVPTHRHQIEFAGTAPARAMAIDISRTPVRLEPVRPPSPLKVSGRIVQLRELAREIIELTIAPDEPMRVQPGQYCRFSFAGLPFRQFSPTTALGALRDDGYLRLHVKHVRGGLVTPRLGKTVKAGHRVEIIGPYGRPFSLPPAHARMVLVGSGTGFAPIWAIASASLRETPSRPIILAGAASTLASFYMAPALEVARTFPNVSIIASVSEIAEPWHGFVPGPPTAHLPRLSSDDVVYAAGGHALVGAVGKAAAIAGAFFHADPLQPAPQSQESWLESARRWLAPG